MIAYSRNFAIDTPSTALRLNAEDVLLRRLPFGTNWRSIRVGMLFALPSLGDASRSNTFFGVGVCPYDRHIASESPDVIGVGSMDGVFTYVAGGYYSYNCNGLLKTGLNLGTTNGTTAHIPLIGQGRRGAIVGSITKQDYTRQFTLTSVCSRDGTVDFSRSVFFHMMDQVPGSATTPTGYTSATATSTNNDPLTGSNVFDYADSFNLWWSGYDYMEVYAYGYAMQSF